MSDRFHAILQPLSKYNGCDYSCSKSVDAYTGHAKCIWGMHQRLKGIGNSFPLSESHLRADTM